MSRGTIVLGGQLSGGTNVWGDKCPGGTDVLGGHLSRGTLVQGDTCPGGQLSGGTNVRGTNVGGTLVRGTNVTTPSFPPCFTHVGRIIVYDHVSGRSVLLYGPTLEDTILCKHFCLY